MPRQGCLRRSRLYYCWLTRRTSHVSPPANGFPDLLIGSNWCVSQSDVAGSISEYLRLRSRTRREREMEARSKNPQPNPTIRKTRDSATVDQILRWRRRANSSKAKLAASNPGNPAPIIGPGTAKSEIPVICPAVLPKPSLTILKKSVVPILVNVGSVKVGKPLPKMRLPPS